MKKSLLLILLTTAPAFAGVAKNPYWQAPIFEDFILNPKVPTSLAQDCKRFHELMAGANGEIRPKTSVLADRIRTMVSSSTPMADSFEVYLPIEVNRFSNLYSESEIKNFAKTASEMSESDLLPGFTQAPMEMAVDLLQQKSVRINTIPGSYGHVMSGFGLEPLPVEVVQRNGQVQIKMKGLDTACDFMYGRVQLTIDTEGVVKISADEVVKMQALYKSIEKATVWTMKRKKSVRQTAAALGLQYNQILKDSQFSSADKNIDYVGSLIDMLFADDRLTLSPLWKNQTLPDVTGVSEPVKIRVHLTL